MKKNKLVFILIIIFLELCKSPEDLQRIGNFQKIANQMTESSNFQIERTPRTAEDCYWLAPYRFNDDFINTNVEKMADGDKTIIGFRDLSIEYTLYPFAASYFGENFFVGRTCIAFSGYAIRKKVELNNTTEDSKSER